MNRVVLAGCRSEPLGSYLQGLGFWRAVTRVGDPDALAHWEAGQLVVTTKLNEEGLMSHFQMNFTPLPIVSPWNAGSGFAGNGKSVEAERALAAVRSTTDRRFGSLRRAVVAGDEVVAEGRKRGWGGSRDEIWDKARKADVVQLCRNRLPDEALPWIDAAIVLGQDGEPTYSRLLGTGANFGRQDLSSTYIQRTLSLLLDESGMRRSEPWLRAALFGDESVPYLRGAVGQFDPVHAGGIQTSPFEKADDTGFVNPWSTLLTFEGTLPFASAVVRRLGALMSRAALPYQVRASAAGFSSSAPDENVLGELWTPEWSRPAHFAEVEQLLSEGRADWRGHPARTGLDFVRAVASLGVDRGLSGFTRHVFGERLGQSPLAVPVGRIAVRRQGLVGLLAEVDPWLERLRRTSNSPAAAAARLRQVDGGLYAVARGAPGAFRELIIALGRLHEVVSRSGRLRSELRPLVIKNAAEWWDALEPDFAELRIAGALASAADSPAGGGEHFGAHALRLLLTSVTAAPGGKRLEWANRPAQVPWSEDVVEAVALAHRRRAIPGTVEDSGDPQGPTPAVRGVLTAYAWGMQLSSADVAAWVTGRLDDRLLGDYLRGLLLLDWSQASGQRLREPVLETLAPFAVRPPALAALLPFFSPVPLRIRLREETDAQPIALRPGADWIPTLLAVGPAAVLTDALRRLRAAGMTDTVSVAALSRTNLRGDRLAAALLLRVSAADRIRALTEVALLPPQRELRHMLEEPALPAAEGVDLS